MPYDPKSERLPRFSTISDKEISRLVTPDDLGEFDYAGKLGMPGRYPFTRGVQESMYRHIN